MNNNKKATKRALLTSVMALVMCVVMLVGTTFAWFTDTASTGVNKIQAGNLDVELEYKNSDTAVFKKADKNTEVFKDGALWEPGHVEYVVLKVSNAGSLALKYKLGINIASEVGSINVYNNAFNLSDYIRFAVLDGDQTEGSVDRDALVAAATDSKLIKEGYTAENHLMATGTDNSQKVMTLVVWMPKSVGNEANYKVAEGITAPSIDLGINVVATQLTYEKDSIDDQYDKDAEYPILVTTGDELQAIVSNATAPVNIVLTNSITTNNFVIPEGKDVTLDLNGFTLTGGDTHAILNHGTLCIKDSSGNGKIVASKADTSALRNAAVCVIEGGTFTRAAGEDNKWHTVENFGTMTFNGGKVIAEDGQSFAIVNGWNYINPGEQKATMTINNIEMKAGPNGFKNCAGGTLTMNGGTLHCTGFWGLSNDSTGIATINGGKITSDKYVAISDGGAKMEINGGTFTGPQGSLYVQNYAQGTVVKGGSYQNETVEFMQNYCPKGYTAKLENGMVVVRG